MDLPKQQREVPNKAFFQTLALPTRNHAKTPQPLPILPKYLQDDLISKECIDFLPSLPIEKGWPAPTLHQYQRFWYPTRQLAGVLSCQIHFQAKDTRILPASSPKSGTTWLKAITFALINRARYPDLKQHSLLTNNSHILVETQSEGTITLEELFEKFCKGVCLYGPFWKESLENPVRVFFLRVEEEMKERPILQLKRLPDFIGCPYATEEIGWLHWVPIFTRRSFERYIEHVVKDILRLCSFETLSDLEMNKNGKLSAGQEKNAFFLRGEVGNWMNYLTAEMAQELDKITDQKCNGSGLKF
ncbi:hypothetical protein FNV43_RR26355 [Rhamnella rubrinervis]|uniref:Sulfotransferase n=1 Tax=Rhamnella rubrinervis TaxID=2594499 RepID=A0A8K0DNX8_9ROSA|nr:hypothetical protein FNV43_RR26355 [Rhamnella rubrinervis]